MIPPGFRPPRLPKRPRNRRDLEREFDITSVVDFVDRYTVCKYVETEREAKIVANFGRKG